MVKITTPGILILGSVSMLFVITLLEKFDLNNLTSLLLTCMHQPMMQEHKPLLIHHRQLVVVLLLLQLHCTLISMKNLNYKGKMPNYQYNYKLEVLFETMKYNH